MAFTLGPCNNHELDSLGRPTQSTGHSEGAWSTATAALRRFFANIWALPFGGDPTLSKLETSGFESRSARHSLTHYCILRQDLPLGTLAAQLIHAAGESSQGSLPPNTYAVALAAKSEEHLIFLEDKLRRLSIPHVAIREPDSPWDGALMAIGIQPVADRNQLKKVTSSLPLLK